MQYYLISLTVHIVGFIFSFWALSAVKFEIFTNIKSPGKVQMLLLLLSLGLGYLVAQFLLTISMLMRV